MSLFEYTGNPFVDTGLAVIVARAKEIGFPVKLVQDLSPEFIEKVTKSSFVEGGEDFSWIIRTNDSLNSYTMVFGKNGSLKQSSQLIRVENQKQLQQINEIEESIKEKRETISECTDPNEAIKLQKQIEKLLEKKEEKRENINKKDTRFLSGIAKKNDDLAKTKIILDKKEKQIISLSKKIAELSEKISREKNERIENNLLKERANNELSIKKTREDCENLKDKIEKLEDEIEISKDGDKGIKLYKRILQSLVDEIKEKAKSDTSIDRCEITGKYPVFSNFEKEMSRDWFPLLGTLSDSQTLPASSRTVRLSAISLLAAQFIPVGVAILGGKLICFQSNDYMISEKSSPIFQDIIEEIYKETMKKVRMSSKVETWGKGNDYSSITLLLLNYLTRLYQDKQDKDLPEYVNFNLWQFSNSGTEPYLRIIEIPNEALQFLWQAWRGIHKAELEKFLRSEKDFKLEKDSNKKEQVFNKKILDCITRKELYPPFYSNFKVLLSVDFENIPNNFCKQLPESLIDKIPEKLMKSIENKKTNTFTLSKNHVLSEEEYLTLLDISDEKTYQDAVKELYAKSEYVKNKRASIELFDLYAINVLLFSSERLSLAKWLAFKLREKNNIRAQREILENAQIKNAQINEFLVRLSEEGFSLEDYLVLFPSNPSNIHPIKRDSNSLAYSIIRFYYQHPELEKQSKPKMKDVSKYTHAKYPVIKKFAKDFFDYYIGKEGKDKFEKRVLRLFQQGQIKPSNIEDWFCLLAEKQVGYSNEEWDDLCRDENGASDVREVTFQLHLELANLYREKYNSNN